VAAAELTARFGARIDEVRHRTLLCSVTALRAELLESRVADDILLYCGEVVDVVHQRTAIGTLAEAVAELPLRTVLETVMKLRGARGSDTFDVVVSILGRRNYSRMDLEAAVGPVIAARTGMHQVEHGTEAIVTSEVSWRIHIENDIALVMLRIGRTPTHRRGYKTESSLGSLHAPVAAALSLLAGLAPGEMLFDPFTGSGTIPIEANALEPRICAIGSDIDRKNVLIACRNAHRAQSAAGFIIADAACTPVRRRSVTRLVSNPPWAQAVHPIGRLITHPDDMTKKLAELLAADGRMALLVSGNSSRLPTQLQSRHGMRLIHSQKLSLFGQWPDLVVLDPQGAGVRPLVLPGSLWAADIAASHQEVFPRQLPL